MNSVVKPLRALHVVGSLRRGGIETWLMNVIRQKNPDLQIDFVLGAKPGESGAYEEEAIRLGSVIHYLPTQSRLAKRLNIIGLTKSQHLLGKIIKDGCYDIVHAHGEEFNGDTMKEAYLAGAKVRVAHCHSTALARGRGGPEMWLRWLRHITLDRYRLLKYGTDFVACSRDAGRFLLGRKWDQDSRARVIYCGIPLSVFAQTQSQNLRNEFLEKYALPSDAIVIGHAGSMGPTPIKNHQFLVKIFAELAKRDSRYYLFLAGDGPLKSSIEAQVQSLGLTSRVRMPGIVQNIPSLMTHLFNVHVMPSITEGFGITVTEATAAGLASVISDTLPAEVSERFSGRTHRLSLSASVATWADQVEKASSEQESPALGLQRVKQTPLCLEQSIQDVLSMYQNRLEVTRPISF